MLYHRNTQIFAFNDYYKVPWPNSDICWNWIDLTVHEYLKLASIKQISLYKLQGMIAFKGKIKIVLYFDEQLLQIQTFIFIDAICNINSLCKFLNWFQLKVDQHMNWNY